MMITATELQPTQILKPWLTEPQSAQKPKSAIIGALQECRQTNMCVTQDSSQDLSPSEGNLEDGEESVG